MSMIRLHLAIAPAAFRLTVRGSLQSAGRGTCTHSVLTSTGHLSLQLDLARGYGHPELHALQSDLSATAPAAAPTSAVQPGGGLDRRWAGSNCTRTARRAVATVAVPEGVEIGAVRISASGWEGAIVQGLKVSRVH